MADHDSLGPEGSYYEMQAEKAAKERQRKMDALFPILITGLYLALGALFGVWHPTWLIFLTIPLHYTHFDSRMEQLTNPIVVVLIYLVLGFFCNLWHPGWLIFLIIPLGAILNGDRKESGC